MTFRSVLLALATVFLAGCATPGSMPGVANQTAVDQEMEEQYRLMVLQYRRDAERIYGLSGPILRAATELCAEDKVGPTFGLFDLDTLELTPRDFRGAARTELNLNEGIVLTYVEPNSPLAIAGAQLGDEITSLNGVPFSLGKRGMGQFLDAYTELDSNNPVLLGIRRAGALLTIEVTPEKMPRLFVNYHPYEDEVNAYADGKSLNFTRGILRVLHSDDALGMVIAHELAHNCEQHIESKTTNRNIGLFVDLLGAAAGVDTQGTFATIGAQAFSQDFEREADYVRLYYLARAGRPLPEARNAFRLMTIESGGGGLTAAYGSSHPSNPERFVRLRSAEEEILEKLDSGKSLIPQKAE